MYDYSYRWTLINKVHLNNGFFYFCYVCIKNLKQESQRDSALSSARWLVKTFEGNAVGSKIPKSMTFVGDPDVAAEILRAQAA